MWGYDQVYELLGSPARRGSARTAKSQRTEMKTMYFERSNVLVLIHKRERWKGSTTKQMTQ